MVQRIGVFIGLITVLAAITIPVPANAQNKVVVITLAGDEIEIAPEPFAPVTKQSPPNSDYTIGGVTVVDNITGLEWQRIDDDTPRAWDDAFQYCMDLSLDGKIDWRLPLVDELKSIVDYGVSSPSINVAAFPSTNASNYSSVSRVAIFSDVAWLVNFSDGAVGSNLATNTYYVRCVRLGK